LGFDLSGKQACQELCDAIREKNGENISSSTLYRMLVQADNETVPYMHNLNLLADFCGYDDWMQFEKVQETIIYELPEHPENWLKSKDSIRSLLQILVLENEQEVIRHFFKEEQEKMNPLTRFQMGYEVYTLLWENVISIEELPDELLQLPLIREMKAMKSNHTPQVLTEAFQSYATIMPKYNQRGLRVFLDSLYIAKWLPSEPVDEIREAGRELFILVCPEHVADMPDMIRFHYLTAKYRYLHTFPKYAALPTQHLRNLQTGLQKLQNAKADKSNPNSNESDALSDLQTVSLRKASLNAWMRDLQNLKVPDKFAAGFTIAIEEIDMLFARV
jgi:hypothetical protein